MQLEQVCLLFSWTQSSLQVGSALKIHMHLHKTIQNAFSRNGIYRFPHMTSSCTCTCISCWKLGWLQGWTWGDWRPWGQEPPWSQIAMSLHVLFHVPPPTSDETPMPSMPVNMGGCRAFWEKCVTRRHNQPGWPRGRLCLFLSRNIRAMMRFLLSNFWFANQTQWLVIPHHFGVRTCVSGILCLVSIFLVFKVKPPGIHCHSWIRVASFVIICAHVNLFGGTPQAILVVNDINQF